MPLRYEHLLQWQQNRSKAMMWKLCEFQLFRGAQHIFSRLTTVCRMLLPHNPYRLPQHYKRHVCGPFYNCKHWFLWISPIFEHYFCLNYMGTVRQGQPCWTTTGVQFIGLCWYFNPQWTPEQAINKASCVTNNITHWQNCTVPMCQTYESGFLEGIHSGYTEKPWTSKILQYIKTLRYFRQEWTQNSSKLRHTLRPLYGLFGVKGLR
jgi:hypothetical protein